MQLQQPYSQYSAYGSHAKQLYNKGKGNRKICGKQQFVGMQTQELMSAIEVAPTTAIQPDEVVCYKCYQEGHIPKGCRVGFDHLKPDLNCYRPNPWVKGLVAPK
jgi:hypothetical protein